ncbi:MAG: site-2 protease family protein [Oligoflexus sp.]
MDFSFATQVMNMMFALILALSFHEAAHAWMAKVQGDDTAEREGRLTLNPIPHMDPFGTVLFPLIGSMLGGFIFGWAKPVPVNTRNLKNEKWGYVWVAAAGPLANLLFCTISVLIINFIPSEEGTAWIAFYRLFQGLIWINAILAFFNLLPLYPLDGGTIFTAFLSNSWREKYEQYIAPYGMFILLALLLTGGLKPLFAMASLWVGLSTALVNVVLP